MNTFQFTRARRRFGRQPLFSDRNEVLFDERANHASFYKNYILQNPVDRCTNLNTQFAVSEAQTENATLGHRGICHIEGGWPKEVNYMDEEQNVRYRKKVEREDNWGKQCIALTKPTIHSVAQNTAVNIYEDYFSEHPHLYLKSSFKAVNVQIYHDLKYPSRSISQIDWTPVDEARFLSVHSVFEVFPTLKFENEFYIWDCENPLVPNVKLQAPAIVTKAKFCPRNEALVAGGLKSGMVAIWDSRLGGPPAAVSPLEAYHKDSITAFCWVHSKTNTEFYTGSLDSMIRYWDGRNLRYPIFEVYLDTVRSEVQEPSRSHGCTCLEFEYTIPIRFMAGTLKGQLFLGSRKGNSHLECLQYNFKVLDGPIVGIERNVFFVKTFLIIGEFCAKIYCEECKDYPITRFPQQRYELTCAAWSPARCSVFVTGNVNGNVDFWDMLLNQKYPTFTMNQFRASISALAFKKDGKILTVGTKLGDVYMIKLDEAFTKSGVRDKALLSAMFERELQRVKLMEGRIREINLTFKTTGAKTNMDAIFPENRQEGDDQLSIEDDEPEDESEAPLNLQADVEGEVENEDIEEEEDGQEADGNDGGEEEGTIRDRDPEIAEARKKFRNIVQTEMGFQKQKTIEFEITVFEGGVEAFEFIKQIEDEVPEVKEQEESS